MSEPTEALSRPFTPHTFEQNIDKFDELVREITCRDVEATPEERRQFIAGVSTIRHFRFVSC